MKYSYHFPGGLLVELKWSVNQNKIALGFLKTTCYSLGKVISLLGEKVCFSVIALKSLKSFLFDIVRTRLELKPGHGLHIVVMVIKHRCKHVFDSVPSTFDTLEHFDYDIASLTGIVINCSVSSSWNDCSNH